jgi:nitrate reductase cytochrome c-type subunit
MLDHPPIPSSLFPMLGIGIGAFAGVIIILLALVTLVRRRARQKRLQEEYAEAERIANTTLEEERRKQQQLWAQQLSQKAWSEQPTLTPELAPHAFQQSTTGPLPCPNCHKPVQRGTTRNIHATANRLRILPAHLVGNTFERIRVPQCSRESTNRRDVTRCDEEWSDRPRQNTD